ncbi:MAG: hypothetical protein ACC662_04330, partial [Planctomycetota bacterium]
MTTTRTCLAAVLLVLVVGGSDHGTKARAEEPGSADVASLLREMGADDGARRARAAAALGRAAPAGVAAGPVLAEALKDEGPRVRAAAGGALEGWGGRSFPFFAHLLRPLRNPACWPLLQAMGTIIDLGAKVTPKACVAVVPKHPRTGLVMLAMMSTRRVRGATRRDDPVITSYLAWWAEQALHADEGTPEAALRETAVACAGLAGAAALPISASRPIRRRRHRHRRR